MVAGVHGRASVLEPRTAADILDTQLVASEAEAADVFRLVNLGTRDNPSLAELNLAFSEWGPADGGVALRKSAPPRRETVERIAPDAKVEQDFNVSESIARRTKMLAAKRDESVSSIAQTCWKVARKQVLAVRNQSELQPLRGEHEPKAALFVILPASDAAELEAKAEALDSPKSTVLDVALRACLPALEREKSKR